MQGGDTATLAGGMAAPLAGALAVPAGCSGAPLRMALFGLADGPAGRTEPSPGVVCVFNISCLSASAACRWLRSTPMMLESPARGLLILGFILPRPCNFARRASCTCCGVSFAVDGAPFATCAEPRGEDKPAIMNIAVISDVHIKQSSFSLQPLDFSERNIPCLLAGALSL